MNKIPQKINTTYFDKKKSLPYQKSKGKNGKAKEEKMCDINSKNKYERNGNNAHRNVNFQFTRFTFCFIGDLFRFESNAGLCMYLRIISMLIASKTAVNETEIVQCSMITSEMHKEQHCELSYRVAFAMYILSEQCLHY